MWVFLDYWHSTKAYYTNALSEQEIWTMPTVLQQYILSLVLNLDAVLIISNKQQ